MDVIVSSCVLVYCTIAGVMQLNQMVCAGVVTRLAGGGSAGGIAGGSVAGVGSVARFNIPSGISLDSVGNAYVADSENHLIRTISPTGAGWMCLSVRVCWCLVQSQVSCNLTEWFAQVW